MRKSDKLKNIEEANKRLLGEGAYDGEWAGDFDWTSKVPSHEKYKLNRPSQYDLSDESNMDTFENELISLWNKYTGHKPSNAAIANDNRVILFNLLMDGGLADMINKRIPPSSLHMGSHGREYYSNNPDQMTEFLNKMGKTDFELKPLG